MRMTLSVIVPVYNVAPFLAPCVESILAQTCTDFELILVDDGSTDGGGALCDAYAARDGRVRVLHQENLGSVAARRNGVRLARGKYIGFVDGDDWIEPNMYTALLRAMETNDLAVCGFSMDFARTSVPVRDEPRGTKTDAGYVWPFYDTAALRWKIHPNVFNKLFRRDILLPVMEPVDDRITFGDDAAVTLPYLLQTNRIGVAEGTLYHYRQRPDSLTHTYDPDLPERTAVLTAYLRRAFEGADPDYTVQLERYFGYLAVLLAKNEARRTDSFFVRAQRLRAAMPSETAPGAGFANPRKWNFDACLLLLLRHKRYASASTLLGLWRTAHEYGRL